MQNVSAIHDMPLDEVDCRAFSSADMIAFYHRLRDDRKCPAAYKDVFLMLAEEAALCRDDGKYFDEVTKLGEKGQLALESLRAFLLSHDEEAKQKLSDAVELMGYASMPELQSKLREMEKLVHESIAGRSGTIANNGSSRFRGN